MDNLANLMETLLTSTFVQQGPTLASNLHNTLPVKTKSTQVNLGFVPGTIGKSKPYSDPKQETDSYHEIKN